MTDLEDGITKETLAAAPASEQVSEAANRWTRSLFPLAFALLLLAATVWSITIFGLTIYRDYLRQPGEVMVPKVTGLEIKEAYEAVERAGLKLKVHESRFDKKVKKRTILEQNPGSGKKVREGRTILVVVSSGPELMKVPKLVGEDLRTAKIALSNSKLNVGEIVFVNAEYGQDEAIVSQNPSAGKQVLKGQVVKLTVRRAWR